MFKKELNIVKIADLRLISTSENRLLEFLERRIVQRKKTFVVTPNPEFLVFARRNPWFKSILDKADVTIPDGVGLVWASRFLSFSPLVTLFSLMENLPPRFTRSCPLDSLKKVTSRPVFYERISGTDLMEKLCYQAARKKWSVYLIGGKAGVAEKTLEILKKRYSGLSGWAKSGTELELIKGNWASEAKKEVKRAVKEINAKKPDLLFVAFGMGKQEKFIWGNWGKLNVKLAMGVGGAFDYLSGTVPRAPKWMREVGLEWLFRLFRQPWRWKRQLRLIEFVWLILKEKFT